MLLASEIAVIKFCRFETLESAVACEVFATLAKGVHLVLAHRFEPTRNREVLLEHIE